MKKVAAIVRCHNNESTVERSLECLLAQDSAPELDVVVVDDGSSDGSWARIERFGKNIRSFPLQPKRGNVAAAYYGLEQVTANYFFLLDADDYIEKDFARTMAHALDEHPGAALAYCDYFEEDETGKRIVATIADELWRMLACNAIFRRGHVLEAGFWDGSLLLPEYDLLIRLLMAHGSVYVQRPLYHYCRHPQSMTRQPGFFDSAMHQLAERHAGRFHCRRFEDIRISTLGAP